MMSKEDVHSVEIGESADFGGDRPTVVVRGYGAAEEEYDENDV